MFMPAISGPSITSSGRFAASRASSTSASMIVGDAVDERVSDALVDWLVAPGQVLRLRLFARCAAEALGDGEQALGRVRASVQHHVFAGLAQLGIDLVVDRRAGRR